MSKIRCDVTLSTGKVISHKRALNGSTIAVGNMSEAEWQEYCALLKAGLPDREETADDLEQPYRAPSMAHVSEDYINRKYRGTSR